MDLFSSTRSSLLDVSPQLAWDRLVAGGTAPHWYDDALPLRFRAWLDRLVGGTPPEEPPEDRIRSGDRAGFWTALQASAPSEGAVDQAGVDGVLELQARVRAPGRVRLRSTIGLVPDDPDRCRLTQRVSFAPSGVLGTAYLLADLPAREVVIELLHRRTRAELSTEVDVALDRP